MKNLRFLRLKKISSNDQGVRECHSLKGYGFTLIEIMVVVVILAIVAMIALPMLSSADDVKIRAAANMIAADMEYAKSMAIGTGMNYSVVFDTAAESYKVVDTNGATIKHPVKQGFDYVVTFKGDSQLGSVNIDTASFAGGGSTVTFDSFGSPVNGGSIVLKTATGTMTVTVAAVTGYISIN